MSCTLTLSWPETSWKDKIESFAGKDATVDLTKIGFFEPYQLTAIRCYFDYLLEPERGLTLKVSYPECYEAKEYAGRMGLFEGMPDYAYDKNKHHSLDFYPLRKIEKELETESIATEVYGVIRNAGAPIYNNLQETIVELIDNILFHSKETGYIAAQAYKAHNRPRLQISIRDIGIGIAASYLKNPKFSHLSEFEIFKDSFEELNTSIDLKGRGQGLHVAKEFIKGCNGTLVIKSGPFKAYLTPDRPLAFSAYDSIGTIGTSIYMEVPYDPT